MAQISEIPRILVYEEFDGHPIYRKGYKDYSTGLKKIEEIAMGTSILQAFITATILKHVLRTLPDSYFAASSELGLHLAPNTNFAADIAVFREGQFSVGFHSTTYADTPPGVVIEVDIKMEESGYFQNENDYYHKKTERLLEWGVERVIWVFPSSRRVLVADNLQKWETVSWDLPIPLIDNHEFNI